MVPTRPSGSTALPHARPADLVRTPMPPLYETTKARVLAKLQERLDALKARRMPPSILAEASRQQVAQLIETEAARLTPDERDHLAREVTAEALGFGPLEELFSDPTVKEVTVLGALVVLARRDGGCVPTNVRFRDEKHVAEIIGKVRGQGEPVAAGLPESVLDVRLPNGFRAVAVVPPAAAGVAPLVAFVRADATAAAAEVHPGFGHAGAGSVGSGTLAASGSRGGGSSGSGAQPPVTPRASSGVVGMPTARAGSGLIGMPAARTSGPVRLESPVERHRPRITERFTAKLASLGVYDLSDISSAELRKVIGTYIDEYCRTERIFLSDPDKDRMTLEILTGMGR